MMAFNRTLQLGVLGAVLALAAVPTTANAGTTMYSDYNLWHSAAGATEEITQLCQVPYAPPASCGTPFASPGNLATAGAPALANDIVPIVPLTPIVTITNSTSGVPMYSQKGT